MPTDKNKVITSLNILGWSHTTSNGRRKNSPRYSSWRQAYQVKAATLRKSGRRQFSDSEWDDFKIFARQQADFPPKAANLLGQGSE